MRPLARKSHRVFAMTDLDAVCGSRSGVEMLEFDIDHRSVRGAEGNNERRKAISFGREQNNEDDR